MLYDKRACGIKVFGIVLREAEVRVSAWELLLKLFGNKNVFSSLEVDNGKKPAIAFCDMVKCKSFIDIVLFNNIQRVFFIVQARFPEDDVRCHPSLFTDNGVSKDQSWMWKKRLSDGDI